MRVWAFRLRKRWLVLVLLGLVAGGGALYGMLRSDAVVAGAVFVAGPLAPGLSGTVKFHDVAGGTWVTVHVEGLPPYTPGMPPSVPPVGPHGFHVHEGGVCEVGDVDDPFQSAGGHWNPDGQPHGNHAGDFPVLFSNDGRAEMGFFTDRFAAADVIGRTVVIHENPDDFRSQPAGDSGMRLACGVIVGAR